MSLKISSRFTKPQSDQVLALGDSLVLERKGSVVVTLKGEYDSESADMAEYALRSTTAIDVVGNVTLNGAVSLVDTTADAAEATASHDSFGVLLEQTSDEGTKSKSFTYRAMLQTEYATSVRVTRTTSSEYDVRVAGIAANFTESIYDCTQLYFEGIYRDALAVTATNTNTTDGGVLRAYGIVTAQIATFEDDILATIKVTATNKSNKAEAYGIVNAQSGTYSELSFGGSLARAITVTATGSGNAEQSESATVYTTATALGSSAESGRPGVTIGEEESEADLAGALTAKAIGNVYLSSDRKTARANSAQAYAISSASFTLYGDITKALTVTAQANSAKLADTTSVGGVASAYGISAGSSEAIEINGAIKAAIRATATAKANKAVAYGLNGATITITGGIAKDITATATGCGTSSLYTETCAYALYAGSSIEITGDIAGNFVAKATGNAMLSADKASAKGANVTATAINAPMVTLSGNVTKCLTVTATANSVKTSGGSAVGGSATAYGVSAQNGLAMSENAFAGGIKVTALGKASTGTAYGVYTYNASSDIAIGAITKDVVITATGSSAKAYALYAVSSAVTVETIGAKMTVKATSNGSLAANAAAVYGTTVDIGTISKDMVVTATNTAKDCSAYALEAEDSLAVDTLKGALKATATSKTGTVDVAGIYASSGTVALANGVGKAITASGNGVKNVVANGIYSLNTLTLGTTDKTENVLAGNVTVSATGKALLSDDKTTAEGGEIIASGLYNINGGLYVYGDLAKNISATALANAVKGTTGGSVSGTAAAYGIRNGGDGIEINGDITGKITAVATSKADVATAAGIYASAVTVESNIGNITVRASGNGDENDYAWGVYASETLTYTGEKLAGKVSVTCLTGDATGLEIGTLAKAGTTSAVVSLDVSVNGVYAYGVSLTGTADVTFSGSKIVASSAYYCDYAIIGAASTNQVIALTDRTQLTGQVDLGSGGNDVLTIHSGCAIKGDVWELETVHLWLDDARYASSALWTGEDFEVDDDIVLDFDLDMLDGVKSGKTVKFTLMKDTDGNDDEWTESDFVLNQYEDGATVRTGTLTCDGGKAVIGDVTYDLYTEEKGDTTTLYLTATKA